MEYDTNIFFEKYEDQPELRLAVDKLCSECPVKKECFAIGITGYFMLQTLITCLIWQYLEVILIVTYSVT